MGLGLLVTRGHIQQKFTQVPSPPPPPSETKFDNFIFKKRISPQNRLISAIPVGSESLKPLKGGNKLTPAISEGRKIDKTSMYRKLTDTKNIDITSYLSVTYRASWH